jgi:hypothetical protein
MMKKAQPERMRRLSMALSALFMLMWVSVLCLAYFGGPFWLQFALGVTGIGIALWDRIYVRAQARKTLGLHEPE